MSGPQFRKRAADFNEARAREIQNRGLYDLDRATPLPLEGYAGRLHVEAAQRRARRRIRKVEGAAWSANRAVRDRALDLRILDAMRSIPADNVPFLAGLTELRGDEWLS